MFNIECKLAPNDACFFVNLQGKITEGKIELVYITSGSSVERTTHWVETSRGKVKTSITYRLFDHPAGFILTEDMVYTSKEELIKNI